MDLDTYKQVITDAIQSEIEAKQFYERIGKGIKDDYLKQLFANFALEEEKHEKILTNILNKGEINTSNFNFEKDFHVAETVALPEVSPEMDLKDAIGIAMKNEEVAMKKYMALAASCEDEKLRAVFEDLGAMEREHKFMMEKHFVDVAYPEIW